MFISAIDLSLMYVVNYFTIDTLYKRSSVLIWIWKIRYFTNNDKISISALCFCIKIWVEGDVYLVYLIVHYSSSATDFGYSCETHLPQGTVHLINCIASRRNDFYIIFFRSLWLVSSTVWRMVYSLPIYSTLKCIYAII